MAYNFDDATLVTFENFDIDKVKFEPPAEKKMKSGSSEYTSCSMTYENDEGIDAPYLYRPKPQHCFGLSNQTDISTGNKKEGEYNICYYARDSNNDGADKEEKAFLDMCFQLQEKLSDHLIEHKDYFGKKEQLLIKNREFVKPILRYPLKKDKNGKALKPKQYDETQPERVYVGVPSDKKKNKIYAKFYGPGDEELSFSEIYEVKGKIEPVLRFAHVYISESGASIQIKLYEANFTPSEGMGSGKRFIGPNKNKASAFSSKNDEPSTEYDPNDELDDDTDKKKIKKKVNVNVKEKEDKRKKSSKEEEPSPKKVIKKIVKKNK